MIKSAIFKNINGVEAILCSICGKVVKTEDTFTELERFAQDGVIKMAPLYCDEHKYEGMTDAQRNIAMSKKSIKETLNRKLMSLNALGVEITRPTQELIIMRGIPGAGKSTKAKTLVGEGIIHSTDALIEATGDYDGFFKMLKESNDISLLTKMHSNNFTNAKKSMEAGVSPVIIDNTNIKASEPKVYVETALKLGFDEDNIKIVDVGTGGLTAKALAERNTHGVPLDKISKMVQSHKSIGKLTIKKILEAKSIVKENKILYSAVVLDDESHNKLVKTIGFPLSWKPYAHHMTIAFKKGVEDETELGRSVVLQATHVGMSDMAIAVRVIGYPSNNDVPHVTVAVNVGEGGKPFMSNEITNWKPLDKPIYLRGTVTNVTP